MLRPGRKAGTCLAAALATVMSLGMATGAQGAPRAETGPASSAAQNAKNARTTADAKKETRSVTLITGDRVEADGRGQVVGVRQAEGREGIRISVRSVGGRTYAVPADAVAPLAKGAVDRRLFDVTGLIEAGYDDTRRATTPLIVTYTADRARGRSAIGAAGASVRRGLPVVNGDAVTVPKSDSARVWDALTAPARGEARGRTAAPGIERVWLDGRRRASLDRSVKQIGAPAAWAAGYDGRGVKVAVLDTGVDQNHPDLAGVETAEKNFSSSGDTEDHFGHGTHVASTVAGSGAKAGGKYKGVAPGARILDGKVLDDNGFGDDSGILAGMQWAVDQGAKVINLSLGGQDTPEADPLEQAVATFTADKGVLFVIAAGNDGPGARTVGSPGSVPSALTVGAVDRNDAIAGFSSVGPTVGGALKPDITAPGVGIVAARAAKGRIGDPAGDGYVSMSGTSMATPHVAGAAALLAQQHPDWTGTRIKQALTASAKPGAGLSPFQQGTGRAELTSAIVQKVTTLETSVGFGVQQWPHADDKPVTKKLTYRNDGTAPVTLDLTADVSGPDGRPAPQDMFTFSAQRVTVPAGGTASVDVTADTRAGTADGVFGGSVVAGPAGSGAADGEVVRTAVGVEREVESYDLTVKAIDNKGRAAASQTSVFGLDVPVWELPEDLDGDGTAKVRLPKGDYAVEGSVATPVGPDDFDESLMMRPGLTLSKDTTLTFDGRKAKPVKITVPGNARIGTAISSYLASGPEQSLLSAAWMQSFQGFRTGQVGPAVSPKRFRTQLSGVWAEGGSRYDLLYDRGGSMFTGLTHKVSRNELARINVVAGAPAKGKRASTDAMWEFPGQFGFNLSTGSLKLPARISHYVTAPAGVRWTIGLGQTGPAGGGFEASWSSYPAVYKPKKTYSTKFNVGVFGPSVGTSRDGAGAFRSGDDMFLCLPLFADGAGHLGASEATRARTTVTADGATVLDAEKAPCLDLAGLPGGKSAYRISTDVSRSTKVAAVSTRVTADWTFSSATAPGDDTVQEALSTVRLSPKLALDSTAKAGTKVTIPLVVEGPAAGRGLKSLSVQVSYDGGTTWKKVPVTTGGGKHSVKLSHPKTAKSVSFKAKLADKKGNTHSMTIYTAYRLVK